MKKVVLAVAVLGTSLSLRAQNTYLPLGANEYRFIDRVETTHKFVHNRFSSTLKPISRQNAVSLAEDLIDYYQRSFNVSPNPIDLFNAERTINISGEWGKPNIFYSDATKRREKPILKYFFQTEPDFLRYSGDDLFLVFNPVLYAQTGLENNHSDLRFILMRGAEFRARIAHRIGIYGIVAETQEKTPSYFTDFGLGTRAFPGFDFYTGGANRKPFDGLYARGYIDLSIVPKHLELTFGYDKHFIGDGFRSLLLGASGAPYTFLRLRAHWNGGFYQSLFTELIDDYTKTGSHRLNKKYASIQYFGFNIGSQVNIGLFESTVFNRHNQLDIFNFIPVIYANSVHRALEGTSHKTTLGLTLKVIPAKNFQIYGQASAQSIDFKEWSNGHWINQYASQLGLKYFNVGGLKNLDLQLEWNQATPWMYAALDSITNYTHYNQALAHPMGNSFQEFIGAIYYQPIKKLDLSAKVVYASKAGQDSLGYWNAGIFNPINNRSTDQGYNFFANNPINGWYFNIHGAYELIQNVHLDAGISHTQIKPQYNKTSTMVYLGIRWNMQRREYDFW